jgi:hypothetical protein
MNSDLRLITMTPELLVELVRRAERAEAELARLQQAAGRLAYWLVDQGCRYEFDGRAQCTYCGVPIIGAGNDCNHAEDCDYGVAIQMQVTPRAPRDADGGAMKEPRTLGEAVDQNGVPELFEHIRQLAERHGRIPVGRWTLPLHDGWTLRVNGSGEEWDNLPRYSALLEGTRNGWPVLAMVDPAGGNLIGVTEDEACAVLQHAISAGPKGGAQ